MVAELQIGRACATIEILNKTSHELNRFQSPCSSESCLNRYGSDSSTSSRSEARGLVYLLCCYPVNRSECVPDWPLKSQREDIDDMPL